MGVWLGPMAAPVSFIGQDDYEFTDKATASQYASSGTDWEIAFKASGTLKFKKNPGPIDVFLVGGGLKGDDGYLGSSNVTARGGDGGAGGERKTESNVPAKRRTEYAIVVDTDGLGSTSFTLPDNVTYSANGGAGSSGGNGASCTQGGTRNDAPDPGETNGAEEGGYAFGESGTLIGGSTKYGAGGGGGAAGRRSDYARGAGADGADTGGGDGGGLSQVGLTPSSAGAGTPNTGSGGGGGWSIVEDYGSYTKGDGAAGGSGIVIIRNHRGS